VTAIGLDLGTSRVKAVLFDDDWRARATADEATAVAHPGGGRSEQDMDEVWAAAVRVLADVGRAARDLGGTTRGGAGAGGSGGSGGSGSGASGPGGGVDVIAVTGQGDGCWLVDDAGRPVRPAMLWNDARAEPVVAGWEADGTLERTFRRTGTWGSAGLANAQLRWLADHEPAVAGRAATLLSCGSWVYQQLTGRRVLDVSEAVPFLDARSAGYDESLLDDYGLREQQRLLPPVVRQGSRAGSLSADAAAAVGLPAGTPVVLAPYDLVTAATGSGVARAGQAFAVLGTTLCVGVLADDPALDRPLNGLTLPTGRPGQWLLAYPTMCGTEVLDWMAGLLGLPGPAALIDLAAQSTRGPGSAVAAGGPAAGSGREGGAGAAAGPLVLPYFSPAGERSPFRDSGARGAVLDLTTEVTRADVARATVDGLTLAVLDCFLACGGADVLSVSGGGARSAAWCQAIADAIGRPVHRTDTAEAGALGAALTGAVEIGVFPDVATAVDRTVVVERVYEPFPARDAAYRQRLGELTVARAVVRTATTR